MEIEIEIYANGVPPRYGGDRWRARWGANCEVLRGGTRAYPLCNIFPYLGDDFFAQGPPSPILVFIFVGFPKDPQLCANPAGALVGVAGGPNKKNFTLGLGVHALLACQMKKKPRSLSSRMCQLFPHFRDLLLLAPAKSDVFSSSKRQFLSVEAQTGRNLFLSMRSFPQAVQPASASARKQQARL